MTVGGTPGSARRTVAVADDLRLARLHLRLGMLTLARAELEDLARRGVVGAGQLAPLAEARWRTGEAGGAAAAARTDLEAGGADPVAVAIVAEAAAAEGHPAEARDLMERLGPPDAPRLDALFAGMPRRAFWPAAGEEAESETLFGEPAVQQRAGQQRALQQPPVQQPPEPPPARGLDIGALVRSSLPSAWRTPPTADRRAGQTSHPEAPGRATAGGQPATPEPSLWADSGPAEAGSQPGRRGRRGAGAGGRASRQKAHLSPIAELGRARDELGSNPDRALLRLALVLRLDPTLAPAVLDAVSLRREPAAALIRGDAQRLLGRDLEAEAAFDAAAESLEAP
jgi:hypothetical protein